MGLNPLTGFNFRISSAAAEHFNNQTALSGVREVRGQDFTEPPPPSTIESTGLEMSPEDARAGLASLERGKGSPVKRS